MSNHSLNLVHIKIRTDLLVKITNFYEIRKEPSHKQKKPKSTPPSFNNTDSTQKRYSSYHFLRN